MEVDEEKERLLMIIKKIFVPKNTTQKILFALRKTKLAFSSSNVCSTAASSKSVVIDHRRREQELIYVNNNYHLHFYFLASTDQKCL